MSYHPPQGPNQASQPAQAGQPYHGQSQQAPQAMPHQAHDPAYMQTPGIQPPAYPGGGAPGYPYQQGKTSGLAITSLVCGIIGILLSLITQIPAIITGHLAVNAINKSGGALKGKGMATAGLILAYFFLTAHILYYFLVLLKQKEAFAKKEATEAIVNSRNIYIGLSNYSHSNQGEFPNNAKGSNNSNEIFSLVIEANKGKLSEQLFYGSTVEGAEKPKKTVNSPREKTCLVTSPV